MQLNGSQHASRRRRLISLTPLIDVVFILLLFFMLTSSFQQWRAVELNTASASRQASQPSTVPPVYLRIHSNQITLNDEPIAQTLLAERITALLTSDPRPSIIVLPDAEVALQRVIMIFDQLKALGADTARLGLSTTPATTSATSPQ